MGENILLGCCYATLESSVLKKELNNCVNKMWASCVFTGGGIRVHLIIVFFSLRLNIQAFG